MSASDVSGGRYQLLYSAPEALIVDQWKQLILSPPLSHSIVAIAVDEAHCVFKWYVIISNKNTKVVMCCL